MPIGFLTATERDRLNHFPTPIPDEDLRAFFLLTAADLRVINHQREAHTRLGFALQLCALRSLGFAPDDLRTTPWEIVAYGAQQLGVPPEAIQTYGQRIKTRTTHLLQAQAYLGFRPATPLDLYGVQTWLGERALEHDKPTLLLQLACDKLRRD
jgi:TnpA family transposase